MNIFINDSGYLDITDHDLRILAEGWHNGLKCDVGVNTSFASGFKVALGLLNTNQILLTRYIDKPFDGMASGSLGEKLDVLDASIQDKLLRDSWKDGFITRCNHYTCTEAKGNNSTFLMYKSGSAF